MHNVTEADAHAKGFDDAMAGAEIEDCPFKSAIADDWKRGWGVARAVMAAKLKSN